MENDKYRMAFFFRAADDIIYLSFVHSSVHTGRPVRSRWVKGCLDTLSIFCFVTKSKNRAITMEQHVHYTSISRRGIAVEHLGASERHADL